MDVVGAWGMRMENFTGSLPTVDSAHCISELVRICLVTSQIWWQEDLDHSPVLVKFYVFPLGLGEGAGARVQDFVEGSSSILHPWKLGVGTWRSVESHVENQKTALE